MKFINNHIILLGSVFFLSFILAFPLETIGQRLNRGSRGRTAAYNRPANRNVNRSGTRKLNRANSRQMPATARPSINGGSRKSPSRNANFSSARKVNTSRLGANIPQDKKREFQNRASNLTPEQKQNARNKLSNTQLSEEQKRNINNKLSNVDKSNIGNRINIDNSRGDVNINIDNSKHIELNNRHTVVRRNPVPYRRPPYRYGGFMFYCYRPFYYHPYRPYYWGPAWHPWGFFISSLAVTAIAISINNQVYHYDQGVYYMSDDDGYRVVQAPVGAEIEELPDNHETVIVNETTNNYYYGGTYYQQTDDGYRVVPPTSGVVVENLPAGAEEVKIGEITYVKYGETYYQPVQVNGDDMYEVVNVEEE